MKKPSKKNKDNGDYSWFDGRVNVKHMLSKGKQ